MARKKPPTVVADSVFDVPPVPTPEEVFDSICADMSGGTPAYKACQAHGMHRMTFYRMIARDESARDKYARAKADGLDAIADEMYELADECRMGEKTKETKDGTFTETGDMVERTRLQLDTRKWLLSKLAPKKYGDKVDIDLTASFAGKTDDEIVAEALLIVASLPKGPDAPDA